MDVFELHTYGSAFNLPSIDVRCLATIALLQIHLDNSQWVLIDSNDPSINPFNELPALKDGDLWVTGFRNIATYLSRSSTSRHAHISLDDQQLADSEAFLTFLESRGIPLIDLNLYVSSDNYTTYTRSALSDILLWPQSWTIPQKLRDEAQKRSEHLGLRGLDVNAAREKELKKENEGIAAQIPKALRLPKRSVTALLGSTAEQTRFRLEAVTTDFFEPLEELIGEKEYFLGEEMTTLDCFALAVLVQMQIAGLPQSWLKHALEGRYSKLSRWAKVNTDRYFGVSARLPYGVRAERSWSKLGLDVLDSIAEVIPFSFKVQDVREMDTKVSRRHSRAEFEQKQLFHVNARKQQLLFREVVAILLSSAGLLGTLVYNGILVFSFKQSPPMRRDFGPAGAFLGLR